MRMLSFGINIRLGRRGSMCFGKIHYCKLTNKKPLCYHPRTLTCEYCSATVPGVRQESRVSSSEKSIPEIVKKELYSRSEYGIFSSLFPCGKELFDNKKVLGILVLN